jgi:two-component system, cell cycle response regulator
MTRGHHRWAARAFAALLAAAAGVYAVGGIGGTVDDVLYDGVVLGCALLALWRGLALPEERTPWLLIGAGLGSWFAGDIWWLIHADDGVVPIPSLGDALYLGMYVPLSAAIVLLIRHRVGDLSRLLALDGLIAALAVAALSSAFVLEPVLDSAAGSRVALAVTVAYPVCDVVLVGLLVEGAALGGWVLSRGWALLAAGLTAFAVTDGIYYVQVAGGTYAEGGVLDLGWLVALLLVGVAAWQPASRASEARHHDWRQLLAPGLFAAGAVAIAAYAYAAHLNPFAMALACAALIAVIARMVATFRENLRILAEARSEALTDALSGLGNRRRMLADLQARLDRGGRHVVVLCDLDGFKHYNDSFGHPAGDALLGRFGARLADAVAPRGRAYRVGGDEFCVLLDDALSPDAGMELVAGALAERGDGFAVGASCGAVTLPDEARTASEALRLADTRMYQHKRGGRASAESQSVATLLRLLSERGDRVSGVAELAVAVAARLGLGPAEREDVRVAAALHDVGKVAIPDSILRKPGPLDSEEWSFMCRHPVIGQRILAATPGLAGAAALVRASHERPDGRGYPDGLAGERIPLGARIVAVCDAYGAMVSERSYRAAMTTEAALAELRAGVGVQFDGMVVEAVADELSDAPLSAAA